jgi:hypothetical protein
MKLAMRTMSLRLAVVAVCACMLGGCGTVANFATLKPKVYGGIAKDAEFCEKYPSPLNIGSSLEDPRTALSALGIILLYWPLEFTCTAVGDTLTLPITMALDGDWPAAKEE